MRYRTAAAFRTALEAHLTEHARRTRVSVQRLRKGVAFERLLARLLIVAPERWVLKGALALDFRLGARARATKDMDLVRRDDTGRATSDLRAAAIYSMDDFFTYSIEQSDPLPCARRTGRSPLRAVDRRHRLHNRAGLAI